MFRLAAGCWAYCAPREDNERLEELNGDRPIWYWPI